MFVFQQKSNLFELFLENSSLVSYYTTKMNLDWASSVTMCQQYDSNFISFNTISEASYYTKNIHLDRVWIGVNDRLVEGKYKNYYGNVPDVLTVLNWDGPNPDNWNGIEDCTASIRNFGYNDDSCNTGYAAGCMRKF